MMRTFTHMAYSGGGFIAGVAATLSYPKVVARFLLHRARSLPKEVL